jgi:hypothetical protein
MKLIEVVELAEGLGFKQVKPNIYVKAIGEASIFLDLREHPPIIYSYENGMPASAQYTPTIKPLHNAIRSYIEAQRCKGLQL